MWPHRAHDVPNEPAVPWDRKKYTGTKANPATSPRNFGEMETDRDLDKPIEQLLSDVHEGLGEWRKFTAAQPPPMTRPALSAEAFTATDLVLYSLGRTASMQAVVARENQKTQKAIRRLTWWLAFFTFILLVLTLVLISLNLRSPVSGTVPTTNGLPGAVGPDRTHDDNDSEGNNLPPVEQAPPQLPAEPLGATLQSFPKVHTLGERLLDEKLNRGTQEGPQSKPPRRRQKTPMTRP